MNAKEHLEEWIDTQPVLSVVPLHNGEYYLTEQQSFYFAESYHKAKVEAVTEGEVSKYIHELDIPDGQDQYTHDNAFEKGVIWLRNKLLKETNE